MKLKNVSPECECMCVCVRARMVPWSLIQSVFPSHAQYSQDRPDQNKGASEDE